METHNRFTTVWHQLTTSRAADPDEARREYMTKVITLLLSAVSLVSSVLFGIATAMGAIPPDTLWLTLLMDVVFLSAWGVAQAGHWRIAIWFPVAISWVIAFYGGYIGGIDAPGKMFYVLMIIIVALFQSRRAVWGTLIFSLLSYLAMGMLHALGYLPTARTAENAFVNRIVIVAAVMAAITALIIFFVDQLQNALNQSRKNAEAARQQADQVAIFKALADNALDAFSLADPNGLATYFNPAFAKFFGQEAQSLLGQPVAIFVPSEGLEEFSEIMKEARGHGWSGELKLRRLDGEVFDSEISISPLYDADHQLMALAAVIRDMTERKLAEAERVRLMASNARMETELNITRRIQQMLLPDETELRAVDGLDISGYMLPAEEVGGDYYDVLQHNGRVEISIGDVTGHGLESGVVTLMLQTAVRTLLMSGERNPARFLGVLNHILYHNLQRMKVDRSLTLALLNYDTGTLRLSGQHEYLIVIRKDGRVEVSNTIDLGFPLGLLDSIDRFVSEFPVELEPGDGVVLYSDGITEAQNAQGDFYGLERLSHVASRAWAGSAEEVKSTIVSDVRGFIGDQEIMDDLTLLVLKQKEALIPIA